jgi:hypothetical protein
MEGRSEVVSKESPTRRRVVVVGAVIGATAKGLAPAADISPPEKQNQSLEKRQIEKKD